MPPSQPAAEALPARLVRVLLVRDLHALPARIGTLHSCMPLFRAVLSCSRTCLPHTSDSEDCTGATCVVVAAAGADCTTIAAGIAAVGSSSSPDAAARATIAVVAAALPPRRARSGLGLVTAGIGPGPHARYTGYTNVL